MTFYHKYLYHDQTHSKETRKTGVLEITSLKMPFTLHIYADRHNESSDGLK